jgi:hypothetical protein
MDEDAPKMCRELVESANAAAPAIPPLHEVASSFAVAVARLEPVMRAVAHYFDKKQYALDDCAKAQALHPQLMALYQELDVQHQMLRQHLEHYARGTLKRCLDRTAANPEMAAGHYWANLIVQSEETVALFRAEAKKDKPDLDAVKRQTALLNEAAAALNALSDQHKQAAGYSYESNVNNFIEGAMAFLASKGGKKLNSSARFFRRTGTPLVRLEGTLEYFLSRYNKVLDDYKQNQFCGQLLPCDKTRCPDR